MEHASKGPAWTSFFTFVSLNSRLESNEEEEEVTWLNPNLAGLDALHR